jgi:hypothetical protein
VPLLLASRFFSPLDSLVLKFPSMLDWIKLIISPGSSLGIPLVDCHKFQIFAFMACDILWFYRNIAFMMESHSMPVMCVRILIKLLLNNIPFASF